MQYLSTRQQAPSVDFQGALIAGLAPDGGLYVPDRFPKLPAAWSAWDYREAMTGVLELFGAGDCRSLVDEVAARFRVPEAAPIQEVGGRHVLELFWGPTLSFKDHALQVVTRLIDRAQENDDTKATILVATSGDTGSAAIEACRGRPHLEVFVALPGWAHLRVPASPDDNRGG